MSLGRRRSTTRLLARSRSAKRRRLATSNRPFRLIVSRFLFENKVRCRRCIEDERSRCQGGRDSNCKTVDADDYCGLYLGGASAVPLCVRICVIIDTRWDHELKHEWVLIRRSLSMSSIVQNLYYSGGEESAANEVASGNATNAERVDNDRLFFEPIPRESLLGVP